MRLTPTERYVYDWLYIHEEEPVRVATLRSEVVQDADGYVHRARSGGIPDFKARMGWVEVKSIVMSDGQIAAFPGIDDLRLGLVLTGRQKNHIIGRPVFIPYKAFTDGL